MRKLTTEQFIEKAMKVHGNRYGYELVYYKSAHAKVEIVCNFHGVFKQSATCHLKGRGCQECGKTKALLRRDTEDDVIEKFKKIHGDKYDYKKTKYINNRTKVDIVCNIHGVFKQTPNAHLSGSGCLKCGRYSTSTMNRYKSPGWSHNSWQKSSLTSMKFDRFKVYVLRCWNDKEEFYKIGRTFRKTKHRFKGNKSMPYNYCVLKEFVFDNAKDAFKKEVELKRLNKLNKYLPNISFGGMHECFREYPALE